MKSSVLYRIRATRRHAHMFDVSLEISDPGTQPVQLYMPVWTPGSYLVREFARLVYDIRASRDGLPVAIEKVDKHRWVVPAGTGPLQIEYEVYAGDLSVRGAWLDSFRGFFNGNVVFLAIEGREQEPVQVDICRPEGGDDWRVATGMPRAGAAEMDFGCYAADSYEALIDYPVEMGPFAHQTFEAGGIVHHLVISGRHSVDLPRIAADLQRVCAAQIELFGGAPFSEYWFLANLVGEGYGGLEHRNSTALLCNRDDLPAATSRPERSDDYLTFLGLASHEYFHSWNVKAFRPAAFTPYDLHAENYTRLLWAFEGITSYYDDLLLLRCGLMTPAQYLERLSQTLTSVRRGAGRLRQTLEQASFDAWIKYYRPDENATNALLSYYTQGSLAALALDLELRAGSDGQVSLDDVMRTLYREFAHSTTGIGEDEWEQVASRVAGRDLQPLFDRLLRQHDDLQLERLLPAFAIDLQWRGPAALDDKGGWKDAVTPRLDIGARLEQDALGVRLAAVQDDGAAQLAGLAAGDIIIALNGLRVTRASWDKLFERHPPGATVQVHAFRRDELMLMNLECRVAQESVAGLRLQAEGNALRDAWLAQPDPQTPA